MADKRINALTVTATASASDDFIAIDGSANGTRKLSAYSPTFGGNLAASGNLTVSGTGTNFFNGLNATPGTPTTYTMRLGNGASEYFGWGFDATYGYFQTWGGRPLYLNSQGNNVIFGSGNALVGTTTDSGNGKIQLATHTTSAGGIGFGTDTSLYRDSAGSLVQGAGANNAILTLSSTLTSGSGGQALLSLVNASQAWSVRNASGSFGIRNDTGGAYSLTIDTSNNATFAGATTVGVLSPGLNTACHFLTGYAANQSWPARFSSIYDASYVDTYLTLNGTLTGTRATPTFTGATTGGAYIRFDGAAAEFVLGTYASGAGASAVPALTLKAGNVAIASGKALKLGNAYTAGAPTATGYVTIQDSAGNTYKVLVGT